MAITACLLFMGCVALTVGSKPPNILLVIADDYGFHDIGYHGSEIMTPTLDKLAAGGVKLENYYVQPICCPSRSQLLSGRYQIHTGLQHSNVKPPQPNGLPLEDKTIADRLKAVGYSTHMVGKWHLGFYKKEYMPNYRGFDSFFGYLTGAEDYYTHRRCGASSSVDMEGEGYDSQIDKDLHWNKSDCGMDLRDNEKVVWNNTEYSTHLFTKKALNIIKKHDKEAPLFLYMPFQAVHGPLEVPQKYIDMYKHIKDAKRRTYAGLVTCMDEAVKNITDALKSGGLWEDTVMIFSTDNGGQVHAGGNNYPLRGWKGSLWDGGMHGVGFVHSNLLQPEVKGHVSQELIHISDWYPTLLHLAGSNASRAGLDGYNQWDTISKKDLSPRKELLHNIDPLYDQRGKRLFPDEFDTRVRAALRVGDWKIITGDPGNGSWIPAPNSTTPVEPDPSKANQNLWLFNIKEDPTEHKDLSKQRPDKVKELLERLRAYNATAVPARFPPYDPQSNPKYHGGAWGPWE